MADTDPCDVGSASFVLPYAHVTVPTSWARKIGISSCVHSTFRYRGKWAILVAVYLQGTFHFGLRIKRWEYHPLVADSRQSFLPDLSPFPPPKDHCSSIPLPDTNCNIPCPSPPSPSIVLRRTSKPRSGHPGSCCAGYQGPTVCEAFRKDVYHGLAVVSEWNAVFVALYGVFEMYESIVARYRIITDLEYPAGAMTSLLFRRFGADSRLT